MRNLLVNRNRTNAGYARPGSAQSYRMMEQHGTGDPDERGAQRVRAMLQGFTDAHPLPPPGSGFSAWAQFLGPFVAVGAAGVLAGRWSAKRW